MGAVESPQGWPGVGQQLAGRLAKLDLRGSRDLLLHLPLRYEDETRLTPIAVTRPGFPAQIEGEVLSAEVTLRPRRQLVVRVGDGSGTLVARWLNFYPSQQKQLATGRRVRLFGEVRGGFFGDEMVHPRVRSVEAGEALPDATRQLWKQATGIEMLDGIGATEMFHIFISSAGAAVRAGAIGKVVPGYTAKVVDDDGNEVPRGTVGKLAVIGPTGCKYLDAPRQADFGIAGPDGLRHADDRLHRRTAEPVAGHHRRRHAHPGIDGQQPRHVGEIHPAGDHVADHGIGRLRAIDAGTDKGFTGDGGPEFLGGERGERAAKGPDGGTRRAQGKDFMGHEDNSFFLR